MKLKAFDKKSSCDSPMSASSKAQSGYYYVQKMHKSGEVNAQSTPGHVRGARRTSDGAEQAQAKYIQCILPFLCLLQVISLVSVAMCFYGYKTTLDECTNLQSEVRHLQHEYLMELLKHRNETRAELLRHRNDTRTDIVRLRNEIEANVTAQIRDLQLVSRNLSQAKAKLYDYDTPDYESYEDETDSESETTKAPPPPLVEDGEPDNQPPTSKFRDYKNSDDLKRQALDSMLRAETDDKSEEPLHTSLPSNGTSDEWKDTDPVTISRTLEEVPTSVTNSSNTSLVDAGANSSYADLEATEPWFTQEQRVTRSLHFDKDDPYGGVNPDKNDAEGDYRDVELPARHKPDRSKLGHVAGKVAVPVKEEPLSTKSVTPPQISLQKQLSLPLTNNSDNIGSINSSQLLEHARSLKHMEETLQALRLSWEQSQQEQSQPRSQPEAPSSPVAIPPSTQTIAIHLIGDTSKYRQTKEKHYDVNHRMYHPKGHIKDWKIDTKVSIPNNGFKLENGHLKVNKAGLYFVYAQIYYSTKEDTSGFNIYLNNTVMLRCITTGLSSEQLTAIHATAPNSCYTAGLMRIESDEELSIKETQGERFTIFEPTRSFFGLFKVA